MVPLAHTQMEEAHYFRWPRTVPDDYEPGQFIYYPGERSSILCYGPNYTCGGMLMTGMRFGLDPMTPAPMPKWTP